jgi:hypothetical protein
LWVGLAGRPYARPGGAEHSEPVSNRINRFGNYVVNPDRFPEPLEQHLGFSIAGTKLAALVFYFLGFAACFAATNALPFCFVAAAFACFCAACFCVDFGDLSPICLNYHPWFGRREPLNRPTFGIAPLTFGSQPCLNRGSQIGKTKLSVRKAEERHCKEGQEGRKEAPQAPTLRSISAYGGDEVSHYDQTQKDNSPENSPVS